MEVKRYACNLCQSDISSGTEGNMLTGFSVLFRWSDGKIELTTKGADSERHICITCAMRISDAWKEKCGCENSSGAGKPESPLTQ